MRGIFDKFHVGNTVAHMRVATALIVAMLAHAEEPKYISNKYFTSIQNRSYEIDSSTAHDMSLLNLTLSNYGNSRNMKIDLFGIAAGYKYIDVSTSLASMSFNSTYGASVIAPSSIGLGLGVWAFQEVLHVDARYHVLPIYVPCIPMALRAPEIRILPLFPIQMIGGYEYDLKYADKHGFTNQLTFRYGLGINLKFIRGKFFRYQPAIGGDKTPGYGWEIDILTVDFDEAMSV